jgi:hypothetical protein
MIKALVVEKTSNRKVGDCSVTMAAQVSCPPRCPFLNNGCYAEYGLQGIHTKRQNVKARNAMNEAQQEAKGINALSGKRPLRLHVVGDCSTNTAAKIVSKAAESYTAKHGQPVWTYTHAWPNVDRRSWRDVSVLASCESTAQAKEALQKGYAAALTVEKHPADGKAYSLDGLKIIPCPEQTRNAVCTSCKLCWDDDALRTRNAVIAFEAHGTGANRVRQVVGGTGNASVEPVVAA